MPPFSSRPLLARRLERILERVNELAPPVVQAREPNDVPTTTLVDLPQADVTTNSESDGRWVAGASRKPSIAAAATPVEVAEIKGPRVLQIPPPVRISADVAAGRDGLIRRISRYLGWK